jgi:excisionase family DNA binding protein
MTQLRVPSRWVYCHHRAVGHCCPRPIGLTSRPIRAVAAMGRICGPGGFPSSTCEFSFRANFGFVLVYPGQPTNLGVTPRWIWMRPVAHCATPIWTSVAASASLVTRTSLPHELRSPPLTISTVHSRLLTEDDRARVRDALSDLEANGALPDSVKQPMLSLLRLVADGRSATILETEENLTSNQAAEVLGVSRPFLNKLLEEGRIPYHLTGRDRRIAAQDVEAFLRERDELKRRRLTASSSYETRRSQRLAADSGISAEEAAELGFE